MGIFKRHGAEARDGTAFCGNRGAPLGGPGQERSSYGTVRTGRDSGRRGRPKPARVLFILAVLFLGFKILFPSSGEGKVTVESNAEQVTASGVFDMRGLAFGMGREQVMSVLPGLDPETEALSFFCGDRVRMLGMEDAGYRGVKGSAMSVGFSSTGGLCLVGYSAKKGLYSDAYKDLEAMYGKPSDMAGVATWQLTDNLCVGVVKSEGLKGVVIWDAGVMPVTWADLVGTFTEFTSTESGRHAMKATFDILFMIDDMIPRTVATIETSDGLRLFSVEGDPDTESAWYHAEDAVVETIAAYRAHAAGN